MVLVVLVTLVIKSVMLFFSLLQGESLFLSKGLVMPEEFSKFLLPLFPLSFSHCSLNLTLSLNLNSFLQLDHEKRLSSLHHHLSILLGSSRNKIFSLLSPLLLPLLSSLSLAKHKSFSLSHLPPQLHRPSLRCLSPFSPFALLSLSLPPPFHSPPIPKKKAQLQQQQRVGEEQA